MVLKQPWSCDRLGGTAVSVSGSYARDASPGQILLALDRPTDAFQTAPLPVQPNKEYVFRKKYTEQTGEGLHQEVAGAVANVWRAAIDP